MISYPQDCDDCDDDGKKFWGCGFAGLQGQADAPYSQGADQDPWSRTCPRWCWLQPEVQSIYDELEDYRRGSLGCVFDLAEPRLQLLRIADSAQNSWQAEQQAQLFESGVTTK